eukprot:TRINITY_DN3244_c0_g2_i9.p1 TRINITY_DN3244_c0_g2~~TRINITY_DN3244_c0_g2_i9.p1  ORF type:complete len:476 (-),score=36.04 TRINITY_DN3244_c0_g2_i9:54-1415(-)
MRQSSPEPKTVLVASAVLLTSTTLVALSYYQIYQTRKTKHVKDLSLLKQLTGHGYLVSILRKYFYQNVSHLQIQNSKLPVDNVQGLEQFCNLVSIDFRGSSLTSTVPQQLFLANLTHLNLSRTKMEEIPVSIGSMVNLVDLDLGRNLIKEVPSEIGKLNKLKFLNLMGNQIVQLPEEICQLKEMYRLGLKSNKLQKLPENIGNLEALVELFITGNQLETLPDSFGGLVNLVKLQASFNQLHSLPSSMGQLESLEMCRVAVNELIKLPSELNNLNKLAWFSLAGTDTAAHAPSPRRDMQQIKIEDISLGNKLGDGASGDVYQCDWNGKQVAVKLFKSDTSPDGQSLDEIELSCALDHPSLVKVLAQVVDTSDKCIGLVTELFHGKNQQSMKMIINLSKSLLQMVFLTILINFLTNLNLIMMIKYRQMMFKIFSKIVMVRDLKWDKSLPKNVTDG